MHNNKLNADFNPQVVKELLLGITVSPETEARLGVPAVRLKQWLRELAEGLDSGASAARAAQSRGRLGPSQTRAPRVRLSLEEIHFLLDGFDNSRRRDD